jgi:hypothetical protein
LNKSNNLSRFYWARLLKYKNRNFENWIGYIKTKLWKFPQKNVALFLLMHIIESILSLQQLTNSYFSSDLKLAQKWIIRMKKIVLTICLNRVSILRAIWLCLKIRQSGWTRISIWREEHSFGKISFSFFWLIVKILLQDSAFPIFGIIVNFMILQQFILHNSIT